MSIAVQNIIPEKSRRPFPGCPGHHYKLHLWRCQQTRVSFSPAAVLMGSSLSSAALSWLPCRSRLQVGCSGSLRVGTIMWGFTSLHQSSSRWKGTHIHWADSLQLRGGSSSITRDHSISPIPKETPFLFFSPQSWRAGCTQGTFVPTVGTRSLT